jgi:hypothetical protein
MGRGWLGCALVIVGLLGFLWQDRRRDAAEAQAVVAEARGR